MNKVEKLESVMDKFEGSKVELFDAIEPFECENQKLLNEIEKLSGKNLYYFNASGRGWAYNHLRRELLEDALKVKKVKLAEKTITVISLGKEVVYYVFCSLREEGKIVSHKSTLEKILPTTKDEKISSSLKLNYKRYIKK